MLEVLKTIAERFTLVRYSPEIIIADGSRAAVFSSVAFTQRATGRMLTFKMADFMRFEGGAVIDFRELLDSFDVTQQALGRWLRV